MAAKKWGILATGNIAQQMTKALLDTENAEIIAVASRSQERADAFGEKWHIPRRYGSYEALTDDPDVEIVYIATPHNLHYENMMMCLNKGKHVLCEKAFTLNARQAAECINLARKKKLFLMEAMWMRFFPAMREIREWIYLKKLGDIRLLQADFCIHVPYDRLHRLYNPNLGGGALLDLGIYPLSLATMLLGMPKEIYSQSYLSQTGVDAFDVITLDYAKGTFANLICSMTFNKPSEALIVGTNGYIKIHQLFFRPEKITLHLNGQEPETKNYPYRSNGYVYELEEVHRCLENGQLESKIMPLDDTLVLMKMMDAMRGKWGIRYPGENE